MSRKARLVKLAKHVDILIGHLEHFDVAPESIIYLYVRVLSETCIHSLMDALNS